MTIAFVSPKDRFLAAEVRVPLRLERVGAAALCLLWPVLAVAALALPPFLLLTIAFGCGFLVIAARRLSRGGPAAGLFHLPAGSVTPGLLGLLGASLLWLLALGQLFPGATAAAAPWPVLGAAVDALLGEPVPGPFGGAALGYVLALCGALCWIVTGAARRRRAGQPHPLVGLYGLAAPICLALHLCLEPRLPLDATGLLAAAALGFGPLGLAHLLWNWNRVDRLSAGRRRGAIDR